MSLLTVTMTHRTAPLGDLERVSFGPAELGPALERLLGDSVREAAILSTCNRTEVYAWVSEPARGAARIRALIEELRGLPHGWMLSRSVVMEQDDAIRQLFLVAAGIDSMVPGESEIQGQVREAYRAATTLETVGRHLHALFQWALEAGKKARTETALACTRRSLSEAGLQAVAGAIGEVDNALLLIVGAGKIGGACVRAAAARGARVTIAARRPDAVDALAKEHGARVLPVEQIPCMLAQVDAAVFAAAVSSPLVGRDSLGRALHAREGRPLVIVDLGMPRNVDPAVGEMAGVALYDLERLDREGLTGSKGIENELLKARRISLGEAAKCADWFRGSAADQLVSALQALADDVVAEEIRRASRKIRQHEERAIMEAAVRRAARKLVHLPTIRTKEAAVRGDEDMLRAARWLFGLEERIDGHDSGFGHPGVRDASVVDLDGSDSLLDPMTEAR